MWQLRKQYQQAHQKDIEIFKTNLRKKNVQRYSSKPRSNWDLELKNTTWSDNKHHNTVKFQFTLF